ncbi:MAG: YbbR-like domain-containing protein [bacterium]
MATPFDNLALKLVALVLGLLLWFHVATEKVYNYRLKLPVTEVLLEDKLVLSRTPPDSIQVAVSATGKNLLRQSWRHKGLRVNAAQFPAGRHNLALTPINSSLVDVSGEVSLEEVIAPSQLELHIDRKAEVTIPVVLDINPQPDEGFAIRRILEPVPNEVRVHGPNSLLGAYRSISTEPRPLARLRNDVELKLALLPPVGYSLVLDPESVLVRIEVVPVRTRVITGVPVVIFNTPQGRSARTVPSTVEVTLTGPPDEIDSMAVSTVVVSADYLKKSRLNRAALKTDCPMYFKIKAVSTDSVTIVIE